MQLPLRVVTIVVLRRSASWFAPRPAPDGTVWGPPLVSRLLHGDVNASRTKTGWWFKTL